LLRLFGASISYSAYVYPNVIIWAPWNLEMEDYATLAGGVNCYNIAKVTVKKRAIVSQFAFLCTGTHDYRDPSFPLVAKPIEIGQRAWICGTAFVGPGVSVGDGAVLAAASVTFRNLESWQVYIGNPAVIQTARPMIVDDN
jgi:putative colanic acid biosynthesis acetyltransferase WcaF